MNPLVNVAISNFNALCPYDKVVHTKRLHTAVHLLTLVLVTDPEAREAAADEGVVDLALGQLEVFLPQHRAAGGTAVLPSWASGLLLAVHALAQWRGVKVDAAGLDAAAAADGRVGADAGAGGAGAAAGAAGAAAGVGAGDGVGGDGGASAMDDGSVGASGAVGSGVGGGGGGVGGGTGVGGGVGGNGGESGECLSPAQTLASVLGSPMGFLDEAACVRATAVCIQVLALTDIAECPSPSTKASGDPGSGGGDDTTMAAAGAPAAAAAGAGAAAAATAGAMTSGGGEVDASITIAGARTSDADVGGVQAALQAGPYTLYFSSLTSVEIV